MKFSYQNAANKGGVYKITNNINGRVYIGSAAEFKSRWRGHANSLLTQKHKNNFLQNDFNKCGTNAFEFHVIEIIESGKQARLDKEQAVLDIHYDGQKQCYNLQKKTHSSRGGTRNKKAIDRATDGRCKAPSTEALAKRSKGLKKAFSDPKLRAECSRRAKEVRWKGHSANITVKNTLTGEVATITGSVREFCLVRELNYKAFHLLVNGKTKTSAGWALG